MSSAEHSWLCEGALPRGCSNPGRPSLRVNAEPVVAPAFHSMPSTCFGLYSVSDFVIHYVWGRRLFCSLLIVSNLVIYYFSRRLPLWSLSYKLGFCHAAISLWPLYSFWFCSFTTFRGGFFVASIQFLILSLTKFRCGEYFCSLLPVSNFVIYYFATGSTLKPFIHIWFCYAAIGLWPLYSFWLCSFTTFRGCSFCGLYTVSDFAIY